MEYTNATHLSPLHPTRMPLHPQLQPNCIAMLNHNKKGIVKHEQVIQVFLWAAGARMSCDMLTSTKYNYLLC